MRKRLFLNTTMPLVYQIIAVICGFILPGLIIGEYGTDVNGLVASINQFLQIVAFLEFGLGPVVQANLYKPLVNKDNEMISKIWVSANKFFRNVAFILIAYSLILMVIFPLIVETSVDYFSTSFLIFSMSINMFSQYYFGIVNRLLLNADQKSYIQYLTVTIALIFNTIFCAILIKLHFSIQLVKFISSLIFLLQPIYLYIYVKKHYKIDKKIKYTEEPIKQKWNGIAQHISTVILDSTDIIILSIFSTLESVSVYNVYHMVVYGIRRAFYSTTKGIEAVFGNLIATNDTQKLISFFNKVEWTFHNIVIIIFGCTATLIIPFVTVYTVKFTDANYIEPLFALLLVIAHGMHCLRLPYHTLILSAGHFKQTQSNYIIGTVLNIVISLVMVYKFGLIGVAIGTLVAMTYQTIGMIIYDNNNIIKGRIFIIIKQVISDVLIIFISIILFKISNISLNNITYLDWIIMSLKTLLIWFISFLFVNFLLYRRELIRFFKKIVNKISKKGE